MRRTIVALLLATAALVLFAAGADAEQSATPVIPHAVGMVPAAEAPPAPEPSPAGPVLEIAGAVLLVAGVGALARSWVSPARAG